MACEGVQGVKMSWVELDGIVSEEIVRDDDIRRRVAASGRPLRSHATGMSDDDLLAKLRGLGGGRGPREAGGESGPVRRGDAARRRNSSGSGIPPVKLKLRRRVA
jgi:hypothetical protein